MIQNDTLSQRGNMMTYALLAMTVVVIVVLVYLLGGGRGVNIGATGGVDSAPVIEKVNDTDEFPDGLINPAMTKHGALNEYGEGMAVENVFNRDINNDGRIDRITRRRIENGTAHFYYDYKIELNNGNGYTDITPNPMRTTEGAECALTKIQFSFEPEFQIIKISRPWQDSWDTPTMASKTTYTLKDNELHAAASVSMRTVCDVATLF